MKGIKARHKITSRISTGGKCFGAEGHQSSAGFRLILDDGIKRARRHSLGGGLSPAGDLKQSQ